LIILCLTDWEVRFYGVLNRNNREKLKLRLERMMKEAEGNVQFYPLCSKCFALRDSIGDVYVIEKEDDVMVL